MADIGTRLYIVGFTTWLIAGVVGLGGLGGSIISCGLMLGVPDVILNEATDRSMIIVMIVLSSCGAISGLFVHIESMWITICVAADIESIKKGNRENVRLRLPSVLRTIMVLAWLSTQIVLGIMMSFMVSIHSFSTIRNAMGKYGDGIGTMALFSSGGFFAGLTIFPVAVNAISDGFKEVRRMMSVPLPDRLPSYEQVAKNAEDV